MFFKSLGTTRKNIIEQKKSDKICIAPVAAEWILDWGKLALLAIKSKENRGSIFAKKKI